METDNHNYIELADLLESYQPQSTPFFQTMITSKREFAELASDPRERLPKGRAKFYKHQILYHRFLRAYDDLFIIDSTGTGKSLSTLGFTEYTRQELEKARSDPTEADEKAAHFKRVVVLVKGPTQKNEFKNQLVCKASTGQYLTAKVKRAVNEAVQKTQITNEIKEAGYIITTYQTFTNRINEKYPRSDETSNQRLSEDFSDTIFWIDEAHNLILDPGARGANRVKTLTYQTIWRVFHIARRCKRIISTATPMINNEAEIGYLLNLLLPVDEILPHDFDYKGASDNDIRVLFPGLPFDHRTATAEQIAPYFRGQIPDATKFDYANATIQDFEPYLRGKIGFVRALDTGAVPEDIGFHYPAEITAGNVTFQSQLILYTTEMSEKQTLAYMRARRDIQGEVEEEQRPDLYSDERQASNFVFPDDYWGNGITEQERATRRRERQRRNAEDLQAEPITLAPPTEEVPIQFEDTIDINFDETLYADPDADIDFTTIEPRAFRRFVIVDGDTYTATPEFQPWLETLSNMRSLSCKYAEIVRLVMTEPGNAFIYGEYVAGSGAIVLALCLEAMGFVRYNETLSMFTGLGDGSLKPYCPADSTEGIFRENRRVRPDILSVSQGGPLRYALLTRDTSNAKFHSMMEAMNSYENRHGDYIKVLISSRVGRDGINVNNVLSIHLVGGEWNASSIYQALSRGIRSTSHDDLMDEERARLESEGKDPSTAYIPIKIYKHAAVPHHSIDPTQRNIDFRMYDMAENKDRRIKRIMRILKQCSITCQIHYNRNVRDTDKDYSAACDYDICKYPCVDPPPTEIDYSTYDVIYARELIKDTIGDIVTIYRHLNTCTLETLAEYLPIYRRKYLIMALEHLITNKIPLSDRFGYTCYLQEDHGTFYLDRTYPSSIIPPSSSMSYYTQGIIAIEQKSISEIVAVREKGVHKELMEELQQLNSDDPSFAQKLDALSIEGQAQILEDAILRHVSGQASPFTEAILRKYSQVVFQIHEPIEELNKQTRNLLRPVTKRGRKPKAGTKKRTRKINFTGQNLDAFPIDESAPIVYLHTLYTLEVSSTAYNAVSKASKGDGRTRLLNTAYLDHGWRDVNETEYPVYNFYIQLEFAKRKRNLEQTGLYGVMLPDKAFRIRDRETEDPSAATDARRIKRGKKCKDWNIPDLIDVMFRIGVESPPGHTPSLTASEFIDSLLTLGINKHRAQLQTWPLNQLTYYYQWYTSNIPRVEFCDRIRSRMEETGRILEYTS